MRGEARADIKHNNNSNHDRCSSRLCNHLLILSQKKLKASRLCLPQFEQS